MRISGTVSQLIFDLKLAEHALALTRPADYPSEEQYKRAVAARRRTVKGIRARLWDLTHKSKYVLRPDVEL